MSGELAVNESVAETDEELMETYFCGEEFTLEEQIRGLKAGVRILALFPVLCGCAHSARDAFAA
jgi:elongation factor G